MCFGCFSTKKTQQTRIALKVSHHGAIATGVAKFFKKGSGGGGGGGGALCDTSRVHIMPC